MNCQLYRSNVLLGGQMKYDLILDSDGAQTYVKDLHITPISSRAPYNKYTVDNLFFYNHHENIVSFYKKFSGSFYNDFINQQLGYCNIIVESAFVSLRSHSLSSSLKYGDTFSNTCF